MNPTLRTAFHQHLVAAMNAIAADADARMVADPANCRAIRLDAESALAALRRDLQPDPAWSADQREAFEAWRVDPLAMMQGYPCRMRGTPTIAYQFRRAMPDLFPKIGEQSRLPDKR